MAWNVAYPIDFTIDGDQSTQAIYKFIQEIAKIYEHLNALDQKAATPPQIVVSGVVNSVDELPATAEVGETWVVNGVYYIWDGLQWIEIESSSYDYATENTDGLVRLGTLNGVNSGSPSETKVITEFILKTLLDTYSGGSGGSGEGGEGGGGDMPHGTIVMWYGMASAIPSGWALCDGTNGTPDMRGRFPCGAPSSTSSPGSKGGTNSLALTAANMPAHNHAFTGSSHTHGFTGSSHTHGFTGSSHTHSVDSHTHSIPSHTHSTGSHTHTVSLNATSSGSHSHALAGGRRVPTVSTDALTWAVAVAHNSSGAYAVPGVDKAYGFSYYTGSSAEGSHIHAVSGSTGSASGTTGSGGSGNTGAIAPMCSSVSTTGTVGSASTTGTIGSATTTGTVGSAGSGTAIDNRPAYCELIFIMKL
jgi:microcystin-dependent protein